ncbi:FAD-dependent oxidoreductase [uncultured Tateyamaria sp.]|uniref:NAD(P)/FAD-dependent oxidoreductase n=1 Tax=Tateyamaria sp. 1078 TaxID=3417464 RepID=UPI002629836A|nr:FAD-dependent oxidoreductase [uncultured Tateyamaria sp.]
MPNITIAGGGFAGVWAALAAAATRHRNTADAIDITLVSKDADLCIRPRLYEGAKADMRVPLRPLLDTVGVTFAQQDVSGISDSAVQTRAGGTLDFDRLILATGSHLAMPPVRGASDHGFAVDDYVSTARLDAHLDGLDMSVARAATVVVVGASFSGLEIATALRDRLGPVARIILLDQGAVAGHSLGSNVTSAIAEALSRADITFVGEETVTEVTARRITLGSGTIIETDTCIFATGLRPSPLVHGLGAQASDGRLQVDAFLRLPSQPTLFAAGDVAAGQADADHMTLMSCQHAMPMGVVAGQNAVLDLLGQPLIRYAQPDYATCLSLGQSDAIFTQGWDRTVVLTGTEGAAMKAQINETWIYPPASTLGREAIFDTILPVSA